MSSPPIAYARYFDFTTFATLNPATPLPGPAVDTEYNRIKSTTDQIIASLALIQRSDGAPANGIITWESLSQSLQDLIVGQQAANDDAQASADAAAASAAAALQSETAAAASATAASQSAAAASASASAASASVAAASGSAAAAAGSATSSANSATASANSATASADSATASQTSASSSSASTQTAIAAAGAAQVSADNALAAANAAQAASAGAVGRNKIINGDFRVNQYYADGGNLTPASGHSYVVDRWAQSCTVGGVLTYEKFQFMMHITVAAFHVPNPGDYIVFMQEIEANNCTDLLWGSAGALPVTLSFDVYSMVAGLYSGAIRSYDGARSYVFTYSVPVADVWTKIAVTIPGDVTTPASWPPYGVAGYLSVYFDLGSGSTFKGTPGVWSGANFWSAPGTVQLSANAAANFYLRDVQLELAPPGATPANPIATPFEFRQYGTEFHLCERYFQRYAFSGAQYIATGQCISGSVCLAPFMFRTIMRAPPTATIPATGSNDTQANFQNASGSAAASGTFGITRIDENCARVDGSGYSVFVAGNATQLFASGQPTAKSVFTSLRSFKP